MKQLLALCIREKHDSVATFNYNFFRKTSINQVYGFMAYYLKEIYLLKTESIPQVSVLARGVYDKGRESVNTQRVIYQLFTERLRITFHLSSP